MTFWTVIAVNYKDGEFCNIGVFSTREAANAACEKVEELTDAAFIGKSYESANLDTPDFSGLDECLVNDDEDEENRNFEESDE